MPYYPPPSTSSNAQLVEYDSDPVSPAINDAWILRTNNVRTGIPIGLLLSLTYATDALRRQVSYFTALSTTIRMDIPNGG